MQSRMGAIDAELYRLQDKMRSHGEPRERSPEESVIDTAILDLQQGYGEAISIAVGAANLLATVADELKFLASEIQALKNARG